MKRIIISRYDSYEFAKRKFWSWANMKGDFTIVLDGIHPVKVGYEEADNKVEYLENYEKDLAGLLAAGQPLNGDWFAAHLYAQTELRKLGRNNG